MQATYTWHCVALIVSLLLGLPLREAGLGVWGTGALDLFATYTAARAATSSRRDRAVYVLAILPSLLVSLKIAIFGSGDRLAVAGSLFLAAFLTLTASRILLRLVNQEQVTADSVIGGICVYLLIGFVFYYLYAALELMHPGAFLEGGLPLHIPPRAERMFSRRPELNYFSFETLTTLGFGDITPILSVARVLTVFEALLGQLFLATFIAFLLGNYINGRTRRLHPVVIEDHPPPE